jgi:predicted phage tail protein
MKNKLLSDKNKSIVGQGGGKSGDPARGAREDKDTLVSKAHIVVLDLIGEGEIGGLVPQGEHNLKGCSIYLNGISLQNQNGKYNYRNETGITFRTKSGETLPPNINDDRQFTDIEWETRLGLPKQTTLENISIVETPYPLPTDRTLVTFDTPVTFLLAQLDATSASVIMSFSKLSYMDTRYGDIKASNVRYNISMSTDGWNTEAISADFEVKGKCSSTYQKSHTFVLEPLPPNSPGWSFRVSKLTASRGAFYQDDIYFTSLTAIIDASLSYDNSALIAIGMDPLTFSSIPRREYLVDGLKIRVPHIVNDTWDFATFDMAVSSNPAWILYDILTNKRYGLGDYIESYDIGITDLYRWFSS